MWLITYSNEAGDIMYIAKLSAKTESVALVLAAKNFSGPIDDVCDVKCVRLAMAWQIVGF